jgi:hypothetical protein
MKLPSVKPTSLSTLANMGLVTGVTTGTVSIDEGLFKALLVPMILAIDFDDAWYLEKYPDVRDAVTKRIVTDAREHYVVSGYFEHRLPRKIVVDERWYVATYKDIAEALKKNHWKNAQQHYEDFGFREGRLPHPNFSI